MVPQTFLGSLSSPQLATVLIIAALATAGMIIALAAVLGGIVHSIVVHGRDTELKRAMVERGMSASEILAVVHGRRSKRGAPGFPFASEALVSWRGDWRAALVLGESEGRYFVHYVGHAMDQNEWVGADRVRFREAGGPVKAPRAVEV